MSEQGKALVDGEGSSKENDKISDLNLADQQQNCNSFPTSAPSTNPVANDDNLPEEEELCPVETAVDDISPEWKAEFETWKQFVNGKDVMFPSFCKMAIEDIKKSGLTPETVNNAGVRMYSSFKKGNLKDILGFQSINGHSITQTCKLIEFPYLGPAGKVMFYRFKLIPSLDGVSYLGPKETATVPYIPQDTWAVKNKVHKPLSIEEGEKKALIITQLGRYAIGLSGVWNFKAGKNSDWHKDKSLWCELQSFSWGGRTVYLNFDADLWVNPSVRMALYELAFKLHALGALVRIATWDANIGKGIDDYLVNRSKETGQSMELILNEVERDAKPLMSFINSDHKPEIIRAVATVDLDPLAYDEILKTFKTVFKNNIAPLREAIEAKRQQLKGNHESERSMVCHELRQLCSLDYDPILPKDFAIMDGKLTSFATHQGQPIVAKICKPFAIASIITGEEVTLTVKAANGREANVSISQSDRNQFSKDYASLLMQPLGDSDINALRSYVIGYHRANEDRIPTLVGINRTGWHDDKFYIPTLETEDNVVWTNEHLTSSYKVVGDNVWQVDMFRKAMKAPAGVVIIGACTAQIIRIIGIENFFLKVSGGFGIGKSTSAAVATSIFGDPESIRSNWNSTRAGMEEIAVMYTDMPLWIDELNTAGKDLNKVVDFFYSYTSRDGKTKSSLRGFKGRNKLRGVCLVTAEKDLDTVIDSVTEDRASAPGGMYRRVVEIYSNLKFWTAFDGSFAITDKSELGSINQQISRNYGYVGSQWITMLNNNREQVLDYYNRELENLSDIPMGEMASVFATMLAVLDLFIDGGFVADSETKPMRKYITKLAHEHADRVNLKKDIGTSMIHKLADYVIMNKTKFEGMATFEQLERNGVLGKVNGRDVFILSTVFKQLCKDGGFVKKQLIESLTDKDRMKSSPDGTRKSYTYVDRLCGVETRGYYFRNVLLKGVNEDEQVD